ncbi:MAG: acylneuraminate cytidylyltransferase family protein [Pseudorhodoplanes sp.]|nr:acylneuraminate cytidylyltransferase family protein [Pseudorhodoplanes sp.]
MIGGRRILSVTPARGGSKGVPRKNLRAVGGISLTGRVGHLVGSLPWIDVAVLSTDDEEIRQEGIRFGLSAPWLRPAELSGDRAAAIDVWRHAWLEMERIAGTRFDLSVYLEPTCPLRRPDHVRAVVDELIAKDLDSVWSISPVDLQVHPLKQLKFDGGRLAYYHPDSAKIVARQQLDMLYHRNGAAYVATRRCVVDQRSLLGERAGAVVVDEPLVSIDTELDLEIAEFLFQRAKNKGLDG